MSQTSKKVDENRENEWERSRTGDDAGGRNTAKDAPDVIDGDGTKKPGDRGPGPGPGTARGGADCDTSAFGGVYGPAMIRVSDDCTIMKDQNRVESRRWKIFVELVLQLRRGERIGAA